jgi:hypothetical protein
MRQLAAIVALLGPIVAAAPPTDDEALAANVAAALKARDQLKAPVAIDAQELKTALAKPDAARLQELLDPHVLLTVSINPESRVKVARGDGRAELRQGQAVPVLIKVVNDAGVTAVLRPTSPQADANAKDRFFELKMHTEQPLAATLSGRPVEYAVLLLTSRETGRREATIGFDVGQGTQDLGFRGEVPVLFTALPSTVVPVSGRVSLDGRPLSGATITFTPIGLPGPASVGVTDKDGKYTLKVVGTEVLGAAVGRYRVSISTAATAAGQPERVPAKYNSESYLSYEVFAPRTANADIDLQSR